MSARGPEPVRVRDLLALWLGSYLRAARCVATARPLGLRRVLAIAIALPLLLAVQALHWVGLLLDEVLFPGYRKVEIEGALFVVGMPRSGTSFLQATLAEDRARFTTTELWEPLLAPSIVERRCLAFLGRLDGLLGRPGGRLLRATERLAAGRMHHVHPTDLRQVEEDFLYLLPAFTCFLLVVLFPTSPAIWELTRIDAWPDHRRRLLLRFYRSCLQRRLYATRLSDRHVLSKNPSFTACIGTLREVFPDARFLCCFRDPGEAIPSQLGSLRPGASLLGYDPGTAEVRDRFVDMYERFARACLSAGDSTIPGTVGFVAFEALTRDVASQVRDIYELFGWEVSAEYAERLDAIAERARGFRSTHEYDPARLGIAPEDLHARFDGLLASLRERARDCMGAPA